MKGDFSRIPLAPGDNITRVLFQQGRPLVEADLNEALMALLSNQRKIIRRIRKDANHHHGAFDSGFTISKDGANLAMERGDYRFEDLLFENSRKAIAQSYIKVDVEDQWVVDFAQRPNGLPQPKNQNFVVGLAAIERPMLLSYVDPRAPGIGDLRSGIPWITQWIVFLRPDGGNADNVKKAILSKNRFATSPAFDIRVASDAGLAREFLNRVLRLEVHSIDGEDVELKLALDNASLVFRARKDEAGNVQLQRFNGDLPRRGEFLEAESQLSWFRDPGSLYPITKLAEYRDGNIDRGAPIASDIANVSDQVRAWQIVARVKLKDLISRSGVELRLPAIRIRSETRLQLRIEAGVQGPAPTPMELESAKENLRRRDGWTFRSDEVSAPGSVADAKLVGGTRQPDYYSVLGTVKFDGDGHVENVDHLDYRVSILAQATVGETHLAHSVAPKNTRTAPLPSGQNDLLAEEVSCQRLFPEVESLATRRWLASTTLGEIAGLSKEQLRQRIERDSQSKELDASSLERDLNLIVAKRGQFLAKDMLV